MPTGGTRHSRRVCPALPRWLHATWLVLSTLALPLMSCAAERDVPDDIGVCPLDTTPLDNTPTYVADIAPILGAHCLGCHGPEVPAAEPLLNSYAAVSAAATQVLASIESGTMPPAAADGCCNTYVTHSRLSPATIATVRRWIDTGLSQGDAGTTTAVDETDGWLLASSGWAPQVRQQATQEYRPTVASSRDDVRCFLWAPVGDEAVNVTGFRITHTSPAAVRHALYSITPERVAAFKALDALDAEPGWDCYAGLTQDAENLLGASRADGMPRRLPGGLGRALEASSQMVSVVQYATLGRDPATIEEDRPSLELMLSDRTDRQAKNLVIANPFWVLTGGMPLVPGSAEVVHRYSVDVATLFAGAGPINVVAASFQMHDLGVGGSLVVHRADGTTQCLVSYAQWQTRGYVELLLDSSVRIDPGDRVTIECRWQTLDLSTEVGWGADEEVCLGTLTYVPSGP